MIDDPPLHDYHGPGSVLQRFTNHRGQVLRLGADVDTDCHIRAFVAEDRLMEQQCADLFDDSGGPLLVEMDGVFRLVGVSDPDL